MKKIFLLICAMYSTVTFAQRNQKINPDPNASNRLYEGHMPLKVTAPRIPKTYTLFGENVPLQLFDVKERFDKELLTNTYMHGSTIHILKLTTRYFPEIEKILKAKGLPEDFKYLCVAESALRNQVSRVGASGFWQFMKGTAPSYGLYIDSEVDERYDPIKSTYAACKYLQAAYNKFGNWTAAAASYNCGMGGYNGNASRQGSYNFYDLDLPDETMKYIFRIMALKYIIENQNDLGFFMYDEDLYKPIPTRKISVSGSIGDLSTWARSQGSNYKTIKLLNPWLSGKTLYNKAGRSYQIELPLN